MTQNSDEDRLAELGYAQELKRGLGLLQNFGVSFSIISIVTGCTTLFQTGLTTGGPAVMTFGWIVVIFFTSFVALGMAEIVSAIPTSGGPYYWAAVLAPKRYSAFWSWMVGWFNFLGQVAVTTGITFGLAGLISTAASIDGTYVATPGKTIGIYAALIISHAVVNSFGVSLLKHLNNISIALHSLGVFSLCVATLAKAPTHQSGSFVFKTFTDMTGVDGSVGWSERASEFYVMIVGLLMAQYTITGYDASAHMSEETRDAARSAPIGVLMSVWASAIFGFFFIVSMLFSIQDYEGTVGSPLAQPIFQILLDVFGPRGAKALIALICICVWNAGLFSLTSNSRMYYAFARDRGIPGWFAVVNERWQSPIRTVWLGAFLSFILALPSLGSSVALAAATSIATIGLYLSYALPILLTLIYHKDFVARRGPFSLGWFSRINAIIATGWTFFITVVFCLPALNPVGQETLNYTVVAVGIVLVGALGSWFGFARKSYVGPLPQIVEEGLVDPSVLPKDGAREHSPDVSNAEKAKGGVAVKVI